MDDSPLIIPSSFLPHLPRSQNSFTPYLPADILAHIAILKELYVPPVHGGFSVSEYHDNEGNEYGDRQRRGSGSRVKRERRFSAGLAQTMEGLGLDLNDETGSSVKLPEVKEDSGEDLDDVYGGGDDEDEHEDEDEPKPHLDPFERDWAEKWLSGVVRRAQGCIEEHEESGEGTRELKEAEMVLRDATAVLAMMAGTSGSQMYVAAGSLTRHLLFPIHPVLESGLHALRPALLNNPTLSPTTHTFLSSLSTSPTSPLLLRQPLGSSPSTSSHLPNPAQGNPVSPSSPTTSLNGSLTSSHNHTAGGRRKRKRQPAVPVLLHDAPMSDHLSVGVQTWGSAILLGRRMARDPSEFGLFESGRPGGIRILELGAGTGLLSILCRKLLDLNSASGDTTGPSTSTQRQAGGMEDGLVVATDFLPEVIDNMKICVDLNFPAPLGVPTADTSRSRTDSGIHIAKLDWTTFPSFMERKRRQLQSSNTTSPDETTESEEKEETEETSRFMNEPFDLVLASDCVYDPTHADLLRKVASWVLRLPNPKTGDKGGTFHILSPIRPTFTPELESIDANFPPHPHTSQPPEGLGLHCSSGTAENGQSVGGLRLGTRGGKRSMKGRKGEGRVDEGAGYWWWEVGWE